MCLHGFEMKIKLEVMVYFAEYIEKVKFLSKYCWMCSGDWCHRSYQIHNRYAPVSL